MRELKEWLAARMTRRRFVHSVWVAETAKRLAVAHELDPDLLYVAGLVHDCARDLPPAVLLKLAGDFGILIGATERLQPIILHAPVGAEIVRRQGIEDERILAAVRAHTVGAPTMSPYDLALYVADLIEPGRCFPRLKEIRRMAPVDLRLAAVMSFQCVHDYHRRKLLPIYPVSELALANLRNMGR